MCFKSSFNHHQWIHTWRSGFKQETNSILLASWSKRQRSWRSWTYWLFCITSNTIFVQFSSWKKHHDAVFWIDVNFAIQKGMTFYQTRSNAIVFQGTLPAYCIPKVARLKTVEVLFEKSYMSPWPSPKISLRTDHDWTRGNDELDSSVEQQSGGKNSFNSLVEKFNMQRSPNLPKQNPKESVIDRGNLIVLKICLWLKVKRLIPTRSMKKVCTKTLCFRWIGEIW